MEESEEGLDEWKDFVLSPKEEFPGFNSEQCVMKPSIDDFSGREGVLEADLEKGFENSVFVSDCKVEECENGVDSSLGSTRKGSIAERRAAKFGFNAAKISNNPRFRSSSPLPSPGAKSPYLTIPPGISPTALLDSPILLPNSQLSPTTGTFASPPLGRHGQMLIPASSEDAGSCGDGGGLSAIFNLKTETVPRASFHAAENQASSTSGLAQSLVADVTCRNIASVHLPGDFEFPMQFRKGYTMDNNEASSLQDNKVSDNINMNGNSMRSQSYNSNSVYAQIQDSHELPLVDDPGAHNTMDDSRIETYNQTGPRTAEDGYNWRKYGQKQVKGSEYPRSYYKCTHPNCQVKKKVERSHDGQITEIIYKGAHNHPKPQPCRKTALGSSLSYNETSGASDAGGSGVKAEGGAVWRNIQPGCRDANAGAEWRNEGLERTSSASVVTDVSDPLLGTQGKGITAVESVGTPEFSSTRVSHEDDEEDAATQGSLSIGDDDDNEPDSKRRKKEACYMETTLSTRAVREPRVVVQVETDVDILEDGYRWRKYGQKVVKGNPNPRSYYKCTSAGCTVRKHVERASHDLKFVITTYEGKHNHDLPAARNSSHANPGSGGFPPAAANSQSAMSLPRNPHFLKPEPHVDLPPFDRKLDSNSDFLRANFLRNLGSTSPFYQMNFPSYPNATPYGSFGLRNHHPSYPSGVIPSIPDLSIPLPLRYPCSSDLAMANYKNSERPLSSVQPMFPGNQFEENKVNLLRPKQEQGEDTFYDTGMQNIERSRTSSFPS